MTAVNTIAPEAHTVPPISTQPDAKAWEKAMLKFRIAERAYLHCAASEPADEDLADQICDIESDARWELIHMPAPDRLALLWKLEYLFEGSNGSLDPYGLDHLAQTIADCRRLLGEA